MAPDEGLGLRYPERAAPTASLRSRSACQMTAGEDMPLEEIEVVIPNLKRRYSGGTAANRTIAPLIARRCRAVWFGPDRPEGIGGLTLRDLLRLRFVAPKRRPARIWHARRNTEMLLGLALKALGWRFRLIFNSASQREKSRYTDFLINRMDVVTATSETSALFVGRQTTVIPHGVDLALYRPPDDRLGAFAATGLPGKYGIGTFGRVRRQKGSDLFVESMCRLLPKYPDFTAVVVGHVSVDNRPLVETLKKRIAAAGLSERIRFLGEAPIEEVPLWYQRISIYVFASRVEGFGLTLLEAMAAGDAVVAARAGSAATLIADGDDGVLTPVDDVEGLVSAIEPLMRDPARSALMGARARAKAEQSFGREREVDDILGVYRRLWEGGG
jgi:mannosyltransferase